MRVEKTRTDEYSHSCARIVGKESGDQSRSQPKYIISSRWRRSPSCIRRQLLEHREENKE